MTLDELVSAYRIEYMNAVQYGHPDRVAEVYGVKAVIEAIGLHMKESVDREVELITGRELP